MIVCCPAREEVAGRGCHSCLLEAAVAVLRVEVVIGGGELERCAEVEGGRVLGTWLGLRRQHVVAC